MDGWMEGWMIHRSESTYSNITNLGVISSASVWSLDVLWLFFYHILFFIDFLIKSTVLRVYFKFGGDHVFLYFHVFVRVVSVCFKLVLVTVTYYEHIDNHQVMRLLKRSALHHNTVSEIGLDNTLCNSRNTLPADCGVKHKFTSLDSRNTFSHSLLHATETTEIRPKSAHVAYYLE